ncbi:hypothetical protein PPYR_08040 [Photinus pyralis]|uniref:Solute carrier organic anion transporter family member n=1 Tax=Photinus pyralis TaxID=7054 RepID=A0A1Y1N8A1_PHOPY|nr:solute carrier organic anion transporter family member 74D [Photinus pyralis]XP_031339595.1 solute carrier organic anion transporter family member 74D [Photinus pyralis]XP_031339596.1 solute carrier organic anion transporter family member 74D [Photinus pyralis]KAB0800160.1 hypothetical protein PPYR_08040 [Photinus pyralis]
MWNSSTKSSNNNGPTNGDTRMGADNVPEEQTALTEHEVFRTQCFPASTDDICKETDTVCGLGPCAPQWLQLFASKQTFLIVFCITWVFQGMYHTYFVSVITTIEKLFQIQSKITGIIMSATEIGQIGSSLLLTYYGGQGHRPKWIAWGMVLFAVSSFTCSLPHFIYGQSLIKDNFFNTKQHNICKLPTNETTTTHWRNITLETTTLHEIHPEMSHIFQTCEDEVISAHRINPAVTKIVLTIFFISLLGVGMGQTAVYTLGIPYIDDNVASKESPLYFAITIGVRILGPALGFMVGSLCTRFYADLSMNPQISTTDPRWIGAWWLGLVMISGCLMLAALAMFAFPKRLPTARPTPRIHKVDAKNPSIRDFPKTVKRLLKNDILMFRTASSVLHILPIAGLYTFLPKYLESQFRLPTPSANMISGVGGILVMGVGIIISGVFILRVKPNAKFVAAWIAFTAVLYALGMGILMFIGCPMSDFVGLKRQDDGLAVIEPVCNSTQCNCKIDKFEPVCNNGITYTSACQVGCSNFTETDGKIVNYSNCVCLDNRFNNMTYKNNHTFSNYTFNDTVTIGYCDSECSNFIWYILIFSIFVFIHSTSEVGSMLLILRCVDPRDKAMALGLIQFAIGLFGNVPCPIIYGTVVDSACLLWKSVCGKRGACDLYDSNKFRMFYHGTTSAILLCAFFVDVIVWVKAGSINFVDEQSPLEEELNAITAKPKNDVNVQH